MSDYTENKLIELPAIDPFAELSYETLDCYDEKFGPGGTPVSEAQQYFVLISGLRGGLERPNAGAR